MFDLVFSSLSLWIYFAAYSHRAILFGLRSKLESQEHLPCLICAGVTVIENGILHCTKCSITADVEYARHSWQSLLPEAKLKASEPVVRQCSKKQLNDHATGGFIAAVMLFMLSACLLPLFLMSFSWGAIGVGVPAVLAVFSLTGAITARNTLKRIDQGVCLGCGYSLAGLSDRSCPECGEKLTLVEEVEQLTVKSQFEVGLGRVDLLYFLAMVMTSLAELGLLMIAQAHAAYDFYCGVLNVRPQFPLWQDLKAGRAETRIVLEQDWISQAISFARVLPPTMIGTTLAAFLAILIWGFYLQRGIRVRHIRERRHRLLLTRRTGELATG